MKRFTVTRARKSPHDSIRQASPVRILLDYRPALRQRTGVGEYAHELARALVDTAPIAHARASEEIILFSASWKDRLPSSVVPGATVIDRRLPNRLVNLAWHRLGWPPIETVARGRFDVAHAFHPLRIPSRHAAQVVTIHDLDFLDHPERTAREIRRDYPALAGLHARQAHHVVVNSATTASSVHHRLGVPTTRITVCTPGAPDWARREREPENGCLLFLGTLEPRKNIGVLLDAYERMVYASPDIPPLVLAGAQPKSAASLIDRVTSRPLAGHVELPGYVDAATREALFRRALVFIMPSHTEGFGMPVLEAMTMGVPVVAADRGGLPDLMAGAGRLFEPDDSPQLTAILEELLRQPEARNRMREAGWARAREYTWRASADRLRDAWAQAIATQRGARG